MAKHPEKRTAISASPLVQVRGEALALEILARGDIESGAITGYACVWRDGPNLNGHRVLKGGFVKSLEKRMPVMLHDHDSAEPVGKWTDAYEDDYGLRVFGKINTDVQRGRELLSLYKDRALSGLSIGALASPENAKRESDGSITYSEVDLYEISLVAIPADEAARVDSVRAAANIKSPREFERWLHASGFSRAAALKLTSGGWKNLAGTEGPEPFDNLAAVRLLSKIRMLNRQLKAGTDNA